MGTFLKDIPSFHDFQNIYTKKYMDINVYSFPHRLDVMIWMWIISDNVGNF